MIASIYDKTKKQIKNKQFRAENSSERSNNKLTSDPIPELEHVLLVDPEGLHLLAVRAETEMKLIKYPLFC